MKLRDLKVGDSAQVKGFSAGAKSYRKKLLAMGLTPGTEFIVTRYAPMGDPVELKLRGFSLSLRQDEADSVDVERVAS